MPLNPNATFDNGDTNLVHAIPSLPLPPHSNPTSTPRPRIKHYKSKPKGLSISTNPFNPFDTPPNQSPNPNPTMPSIPLIPPPWELSTPNPNHESTSSTLIVHPLYCPSTHALAKDVIHWLLARNNLSPCQTLVLNSSKEPSNIMPHFLPPSCDPQPIDPICLSQDPSQPYVIDHQEHIEPIQDSSASTQSQKPCQEPNPKHEETLPPHPHQDQSPLIVLIHSTHNHIHD